MEDRGEEGWTGGGRGDRGRLGRCSAGLSTSARVKDGALGGGEADLAFRAGAEDSEDLCTVFSVAHGVTVFVAPELAKRLGPRPATADIPWTALVPAL